MESKKVSFVAQVKFVTGDKNDTPWKWTNSSPKGAPFQKEMNHLNQPLIFRGELVFFGGGLFFFDFTKKQYHSLFHLSFVCHLYNWCVLFLNFAWFPFRETNGNPPKKTVSFHPTHHPLGGWVGLGPPSTRSLESTLCSHPRSVPRWNGKMGMENVGEWVWWWIKLCCLHLDTYIIILYI